MTQPKQPFTLLMRPTPEGVWLPLWICSLCGNRLRRDARLMWVRTDDEHAAAPAFFCGEDCQRKVIEEDPNKDWQSWGLGRFLASSIAICDVGNEIVELFEQLALRRFNASADPRGGNQEADP